MFSCGSYREHPAPWKGEVLIRERDLIPEGLAANGSTGQVYLSSTYHRKIICIEPDGTVHDFIPEGRDGISSIIGLQADTVRHFLWAISSEAPAVLPHTGPPGKAWSSALFCFDLKDGHLIGRYPLLADSVFLNDLAVGRDGGVFVTESLGNAVYRLPPGGRQLELFCTLSPYEFINGICFTDKPDQLWVSSRQGLLAINLQSRAYEPVADSTGLGGDIDGLCYYRNCFIAHRSTSIVRLYLDGDGMRIGRADTLDSGPEFDGSTTGETLGNEYLYIVNSQIQSGVDYKKQQLRPVDSLKPVKVRRKKLDPVSE